MTREGGGSVCIRVVGFDEGCFFLVKDTIPTGRGVVTWIRIVVHVRLFAFN
jgi:hypothetical protein